MGDSGIVNFAMAFTLLSVAVFLLLVWKPLHGAVRRTVRALLIQMSRQTDWDDDNLEYPQTRQFVPRKKRHPLLRNAIQALCLYVLGHELSSDYATSRKDKVVYRCRWCDGKLDPDHYFGRWLRARNLEDSEPA